MGSYNKAGVMQAVAAQFIRIDLKGRPIVGPKNRFFTDSLLSCTYSMTYNRQESVEMVSGSGAVCMVYAPPQTLTRLELSDLGFCYPDPQAIEFIAGGIVFNDDETDPNPIGYAAPPVGIDPKPQGFALVLYSAQIQGGAITGYIEWLFPRARLQFTKDQQLSATDPHNTGFDGICNENPFFGEGPDGDYEDWPETGRLFQWKQRDTLPDLSYGFHPVVAI